MMLQLTISACLFVSCLTLGDNRRARVWSEIAGINERSAKSLHVHEHVDISEIDGTLKEYASRDVRFNELGNARIEGSRWATGSMDGVRYHHIERFQLLDGVFRSAEVEQGIGVAFTAESRSVSLRDEPNVLLGLGTFRPSNTLLSRSEFFGGCSSLHLVQDDAEHIVVEATERLSRLNRRPYTVRLQISPVAGDVLAMTIVDTKWGHIVAQYGFSQWTQCGTLRVPLCVTYEQYDLSVARDVRKRIEDEASRIGIGREGGYADDPRYQEWCLLRDREIPPPAPSRRYPRVMSTQVSIEAVNETRDVSWFSFQAPTRLSQFLSGALDCPVDTFDVEPSEGYLGPKPRE